MFMRIAGRLSKEVAKRREVVLFLIWGVISRGLPFLLLPIIARLVPKTVFADFSLLLPASALCMMLMLMGTQYELTRTYFVSKASTFQLMSTSARLYFLVATITIILLLFFNAALLWFYAAVLGFAIALLMLPLLYLRMDGRIHVFGMLDTLRIGLPYMLLLATVLLPDLNYMQWSCLGLLLIYFLTMQLLKRESREAIPRADSGAYTVTGLIYSGIFLLPHYLSLYFLAVFDRYIIGERFGLMMLADYAMGVSLGQMVLLLTDALNKWWSPYAMKLLVEGRGRDVALEAKKIGLVAVAILPFAGLLMYGFVNLYLPDNYQIAPLVAAVCSVSYLVQLAYILVFPFLIHQNKMRSLSIISIVATLCGIAVITAFVFFNMMPFVPLGYMATFLVQVAGILWIIRVDAVQPQAG